MKPNYRLLIVDRDRAAAERRASFVEPLGYDCRISTSPEECRFTIDEGYEPDLVIVEEGIGLRRGDASELANELTIHRDLPVLVAVDGRCADLGGDVELDSFSGIVPREPTDSVCFAAYLSAMIELDRKKRDFAQEHAKLVESEERFRRIFSAAPVGMFLSTPEGRFLDLNTTLADMLGYDSVEEVLAEITDIAKQIYVRSEDRRTIVAATIRRSSVEHYINVYRRRDGSHFRANLYLTTIRNAEGNVAYLEGIVEDLSAREALEHQLQEKQEQLTRAMEVMHEALVIYDVAGNVLIANSRAEEILGRDEGEIRLIGHDSEVWGAIHPDGAPFRSDEFPATVTLATGRSTHHVKMGILRGDGPRVWISTNAEPLGKDSSGSPTGAVVSFRDVTGEYYHEQELESVLNGIDAAMWITALDTDTIVFMNPTAIDRIGDQRTRRYAAVASVFVPEGTDQPEGTEHPSRREHPTANEGFNGVPLFGSDGEPIAGTQCEVRMEDRGEWYRVFSRPIRWAGSGWVRLDVAMDITALKEDAARHEHMLVEINHRVKNNLMMVGALARIEMSAEDKSKEDSLRDISARIDAISLVHQQLYAGDDMLFIDAEQYFSSLAESLSEATHGSAHECIVRVASDPIRFSSKRMTTLGLVVVELFNNTQKYGRTEGRSRVELVVEERDERIVIDYRDDGVGISTGLSVPTDLRDAMDQSEITAGTGLSLVDELVSDLSGTVQLIPEERGAHFRIVFSSTCS
jgi:PAS domain S-box-containing protein